MTPFCSRCHDGASKHMLPCPECGTHLTTDWLLKGGRINDLQQQSIVDLVKRCKRAHLINVHVRINGTWEIYQADWIKHLSAIPTTALESLSSQAEKARESELEKLLASDDVGVPIHINPDGSITPLMPYEELAAKSDAEMERVKACEHIADGDEGWEALRNLCPSTAAVSRLRDAFSKARGEAIEEAAKYMEGALLLTLEGRKRYAAAIRALHKKE